MFASTMPLGFVAKVSRWACLSVVSRAWQNVAISVSSDIMLHGTGRKSPAPGEISGFRGTVRHFGYVRASILSRRARRCEIVAGAGNALIWMCARGGHFAERSRMPDDETGVVHDAVRHGTQWEAASSIVSSTGSQ